MRKYVDFIEGTDGKAVVGASVRVLTYPAGTVATIYQDAAAAVPLANPLTTDGTGGFAFYAVDGHYSFEVSGRGVGAKTISDVSIFDEDKFVASSELGAFNIYDYGAVANGTAYSAVGGTDNGPFINAAITAAAAAGKPATVYIPDGVWNVATQIIQQPNVSIHMGDGAVLNVTAALDAVISTPLASLLEDVGLFSGTILCNGLANTAVELKWFRHYKASNVLVEDWLTQGWRVGDPGASTCYEFIADGLRTHRRSAAVPAASICVWIRAATDAQMARCVLIGGEVGLNCQSGGTFEQIHCWTRASTGAMKAGFLFTGGGAQIVNCYADTPTENGYDLTGTGYVLINPQTFNNNGTSATDNVAVSIRLRTVNPNVTIVGAKSEGGDVTHRLKNDLVTADGSLTGVTWLGPVNINTVNTTRASLPTETVFLGDLDISGANNTNRNLSFMTNVVARYQMRLSGNETGSNAGGDLSLVARTDAGSFLRTDWSIARSNGAWTIGDASGTTTGAHLVYGAGFGVKTVGAGFRTAEGSNAKQGTATLVAGSSVVANTSVTATSRIFLTSQADGGTPGFLRVSARTAGTSFTITSSNAADTSTVAYEIFEPA